MFMCTTRFDIQSEQLALVDEFLSTQEKHTKKEQDNAEQEDKVFDPISDDEEDLTIETSIEGSVQQPSLRALGKRRATDDQLTELEDDEIPLPAFDIQRRSSGRIPKRLRHDADFVYN